MPPIAFAVTSRQRLDVALAGLPLDAHDTARLGRGPIRIVLREKDAVALARDGVIVRTRVRPAIRQQVDAATTKRSPAHRSLSGICSMRGSMSLDEDCVSDDGGTTPRNFRAQARQQTNLV
jgi:hypothetical protein